MNNDWVIGILTGIISSGRIFVGSVITNKYIVPKIHGMIQRVPDISGTWEHFDSNEANAIPVGHAEIKQWGSKIEARFVRTKARDGSPRNRVFTATGSFQAAQLVLIFEDIKSAGFVTGSLVLKLSSRLDYLAGKSLYFEPESNTVNAYEMHLRRTM